MTWRSHAVAGALAACVLAAPARALTIVPTWDVSITSLTEAATIEATISSAIQLFQSTVADPVTVNITFRTMTTGLGASSTQLATTLYSWYVAALQDHAGSADDAVLLAHNLPPGTGNPVNNNVGMRLSVPLARAIGLIPGPQSAPEAAPSVRISVLNPRPGDPNVAPLDLATARRQADAFAAVSPATALVADGTISFNLNGGMNITTGPTPSNQYSLFAVACHEIDEVLGFGTALNGLANGAPAPTGVIEPMDLMRFDGNGQRSWTTSAAQVTYCSFDGVSQIVQFNPTQGGDFSDWLSSTPTPRVQDSNQTLGADPTPNVEWRVLDAIGWNLGPRAYWVDYAYAGGTRNGSYATPYASLGEANAVVPAGSNVFVKGPASTFDRPVLTRPMTVLAVGGNVTVGQ